MQPPLPETLLSSFKRYQNDNILPTGVVHPFENAASESSVLVEDLIKATSSLSTALHAYSSIPWSNPKLVSLLRQNASIAHTTTAGSLTKVVSSLLLLSASVLESHMAKAFR